MKTVKIFDRLVLGFSLAIVTSVLLVGCGPSSEEKKERSEAVARVRMQSFVHQSMGFLASTLEELDGVSTTDFSPGAEYRAVIRHILDKIIAHDVSLCPSSFRESWYQLTEAAQELKSVFEMESIPDVSAVEVMALNFENRTMEVVAVAEEHGVTTYRDKIESFFDSES